MRKGAGDVPRWAQERAARGRPPLLLTELALGRRAATQIGSAPNQTTSSSENWDEFLGSKEA